MCIPVTRVETIHQEPILQVDSHTGLFLAAGLLLVTSLLLMTGLLLVTNLLLVTGLFLATGQPHPGPVTSSAVSAEGASERSPRIQEGKPRSRLSLSTEMP
jgi:hypothetical protein